MWLGRHNYWFNNEQNLLTKPAEIIRDNDDVNVNYFFIWDNGRWKRSWSNVPGNDWAPLSEKNSDYKQPLLIEYILGEKNDWKIHYDYVKTHFKSEKYIKVDNKPVFCIFNTSPEIFKMCDSWNEWAKNDGYSGMYFIFNGIKRDVPLKYKSYNYEPHFSGLWRYTLIDRIENRFRKILHRENHIAFYDFDKVWNVLLKDIEQGTDNNVFFGAFVGYDDTPRRGFLKSKIIKGSTPQKFEKYLERLVLLCQKQKKEFIFLSAWNEWGEGMFLEPDTINGYEYLEAIKKVMTNN